ncbi:MAG: hypothetical protein IKR19_08700 [Acholeplasmatales bacterium]|nr:hypothetical protein [Acholeplasmatales bacterium]
MKITRKLSEFEKFILSIGFMFLIYFCFEIAIDTIFNYTEITRCCAIVVDKDILHQKSLLSSETYVLKVRYSENGYTGYMKVSKYLYNAIELDQTIYIKIYNRYRKSDNQNIETQIVFDHL